MSPADVVASVCLVAGCFLCLTAGLGLIRFPDVLNRMHAATKPQVLGVLLVMTGAVIRLAGQPIVWMLVLVAVFQLITAPVSAHMVSRIAYRRRHVRRDLLLVDELGRPGTAPPTRPHPEHPEGDPDADEPADGPESGPRTTS
ncbi:monovalent cation/H(+) antiporter subunit G [Modestobacter sp. Leaf380]|uniref:monovalent cation/H(+) antiporter subunit G n=1 Tax=Modestobacter sp. Leaf380 TaxID=1736356 RepID=UPI000700D9BD|nr:monovalent cation/H(+) antiporter subunit G [Modestobacter sp. Leaf380]KQS68726.1 cation:proton antiporter [Modestobacter sp. Leaf380]